MTKNNTQLHLIKAIFLAFGLFTAIITYSGCSSSSSPSDQSTVTTSTQMENSSVSASHLKSSDVITSGLTCDSVVITKARIVISTLKLHHDDADTNGQGTIKAGPFVAEFDASGATFLSTVTVPPGNYDRIKFEIHKLDDKADASLLNNPIFGDFVNGGRYTVIIDGKVYVNGASFDFSFKSSKTDNVTIFITPPATFSAGASYNLAFVFDPKLVFGQPGLRPLDPRSTDNQSAIEKLIKDALKALKK